GPPASSVSGFGREPGAVRAPVPRQSRYRDANPARVDPRASANDARRRSTQPLMSRERMRRHGPRTSPSWTRDSGPTDATMCASALAPVRTTIQFFATRFTHRELGVIRDFDGGAYGCERDTIGAAGYVLAD